jgi:hypothetical protein
MLLFLHSIRERLGVMAFLGFGMMTIGKQNGQRMIAMKQ